MPSYLTGYRWSKLLVKVGDGQVTETFAEPCGLTTKRISFTNTSGEIEELDCDNPDGVAPITRFNRSRSMSITGSGRLSAAAWKNVWQPWVFDGGADGGKRNLEIQVDATGAEGGGVIAGPFVLENFDMAGEKANEAGEVTFDLTLMSAGVYSWTDAA